MIETYFDFVFLDLELAFFAFTGLESAFSALTSSLSLFTAFSTLSLFATLVTEATLTLHSIAFAPGALSPSF